MSLLSLGVSLLSREELWDVGSLCVCDLIDRLERRTDHGLGSFHLLLCDAGHRCQDLTQLAAAGQLAVGCSPQGCPPQMLDHRSSRAVGDAASSPASLASLSAPPAPRSGPAQPGKPASPPSAPPPLPPPPLPTAD